jgi:hypothetical protein
MPNSNDNQDLEQDKVKDNQKDQGNKEGDLKDAGNFTSDNQKGKKVDADPTKESEKPADV